MNERAEKIQVCFVGGTRYPLPLSESDEKKFRALARTIAPKVVAFSSDFRPRIYCRHADFFLLPCLPSALLRYLELATLGPLLVFWIGWRNDISVLIAQSPFEGAVAALGRFGLRAIGKKVALVVESHGDFEASLFMQRRVRFPGLYRALMQRAARFAFSQADMVRAVSSSTREQLAKWAPRKPVAQFAAWTDIEAFLSEFDRSLPDQEEQVILYAGVLIPRKGVEFLVEAFARLAGDFPQAVLQLVGKPENVEYAEKLKTRIREHGLEKRVRFVPNVSQAELAALFRQAQVMVLPSISEALGRVVFEAMATGLPVIGTRVGGIPDMIEEGETGFLVPVGDCASLETKLRWVLNHPEERKRMGSKAHAFARKFFSTDGYVDNYRQLVQRAFGSVDG